MSPVRADSRGSDRKRQVEGPLPSSGEAPAPLAAGCGDAHCHLADLPDPAGAVSDAARAGTGPILAVSMTPEDAAAIFELRERHPGRVVAGVGLHPSRVPDLTDEAVSRELALVMERANGSGGGGAADFIGEIGLDFKDARDDLQQRRQREVLERLMEIAEASRLPVNLHTRRADRELVERAREFTSRTGLPAVIHWFTHSKKLAWRCADAGIYISAGPSIRIDPAQMDVARAVAEDLLLVETDSPVSYAGENASPSWAPGVAAALAEARGLDEAELVEILQRNLARFLGAGDGGPLSPSGS